MYFRNRTTTHAALVNHLSLTTLWLTAVGNRHYSYPAHLTEWEPVQVRARTELVFVPIETGLPDGYNYVWQPSYLSHIRR